MRTMAEDNQVHQDVVSKLWQVYSTYLCVHWSSELHMVKSGTDKDIPKAQRRGAIVIIGMIAVARPKFVTERIDTLLHVGLGPLGKVRLCFLRSTPR